MINENDGTKFQNMGRFATFLVPTLSWYITRYQYYFCLNLLFLNLTMLGSSIAYFYSLLKSGDRQPVVHGLWKTNLTFVIFLLETLDFKLIRQWQITFSVFNGISFIFKIVIDVAYPNMQNWKDSLVLPFMLGILISQIVFSICKTYLEIFVHLDKI